MSENRSSSSHGPLIIAVLVVAAVIVLAFASALVWPGWALKQDGNPSPSPQATSSLPTKPSIEAKALPSNASELLKAMPDSVLNFARTEANPSANWTSSSPLEEYSLKYSTGEDTADILLTVAQWSTRDSAKTQYDALAKALNGKDLGAGNVKVSGEETGSYVIKADESDESKAVGVWQNDTVVFKATGTKESVERFIEKFPL